MSTAVVGLYLEQHCSVCAQHTMHTPAAAVMTEALSVVAQGLLPFI